MSSREGFDLRHAKGVQLGSGNVQHNYLPQRAPIDWPLRVGTPPPLARARVTRELDALLEAATGCHVLTGMSGLGKTQAAAALAHRLWSGREVDLLLWLDAGSRESIVTAYAEAADELRISGGGNADRDADRLLSWLAAPRDGRRWLVVLDGLHDPADLRNLWPPDGEQGRVLITTQRTDVALRAQAGTVTSVGPYSSPEAERHLRNALADHPELYDDGELTKDLEYLPYAIAQAAAYMVEEGVGCRSYRNLLRTGSRRHGLDADGQIAMAVEAVDRLDPPGQASKVLRLASLLDADGMPGALFATDAVREHLGKGVRKAMANLARYSLLTRQGELIRMPATVQRAVRDGMSRKAFAELGRACADGLMELWPQEDPDPVELQLLRDNTARLRTYTGDVLLTPEPHELLREPASSLMSGERFAAAGGELAALYADIARVHGADSEHTLEVRLMAAAANGLANDPYGGWREYAAVFEADDGTPAPGLRCLAAMLRGLSGDPHGASDDLDRALADMDDPRSAEHHGERLFAGMLHCWAGRPLYGIRLLAGLHDDALREFGRTDTKVLDTRLILASGHLDAGDLDGAEVQTRALIADSARYLGPGHADTIRAQMLLGRVRGEAGHAAEAVELLAPVRAALEARFGPEHLDAGEARRLMARYRGKARDFSGAAQELIGYLEETKAYLVRHHPSVFEARRDLARFRSWDGDHEGAAQALKRLLNDMRPYLPPHAPLVLHTRRELARLRTAAGDITGAIAAYRALIEVMKQVWEPTYPPLRTTEYRLQQLLAKPWVAQRPSPGP